MYLNANQDWEEAAHFEILDLDTNKIIPHVLWANDYTGEYAQYVFDLNGCIQLTNNEPDLIIKKGNIKFKEKK
jgi:hypothetical protein